MSDKKKPPKRPRLISVTREPQKSTVKETKLRDCRCYDEIVRRLRLGETPRDVAEMIQDEYGELSNLSRKYVIKLVDECRLAIPPTEIALYSKNVNAVKKAKQQIRHGLDELEELERLYKLQMQRVSIDFENEKKINKLFPTTGREIYYAMKLLKQSSDLKMDLGYAKRHHGEMNINASGAVEVSERYKNEAIGQVMTDPDSRRKVLGMVETLVKLGAKASIDATEAVNAAAAQRPVIDVTPPEETD